MHRAGHLLAAALLAGAAAATASALLDSLPERHLAHGLWRLAVTGWLGELVAVLPVALVGGAVASAIAAVAERVGGRPPALEVLAWIAATGPPAAWLTIAQGLPVPQASIALLLFAGTVVAVWLALRATPKLRVGISRAAAVALLGAVGTALSVAVWLHASRPTRSAERPNLLVIVLDTVRADRLSCYGYGRLTTPELDRLANDAIRFDDFYSTSSWTIPSHASLFTGLYPRAHGATQEHMRLSPGFTTLAEILANEGYTTWAASGNPWLGHGVNLTQGFERMLETWRYDVSVDHQHPPGATHPAAAGFEAFLADADPDVPFFAFVNFMDAHMPYTPPEPFLRRFLPPGTELAEAMKLARLKWNAYYRGAPYDEHDLALLSQMYDAAIAYTSASAGQLLDVLRARGLEDETLIVVTSDHGEMFGESGQFQETGLLGHMFGLYNGTVRVPLIVRLPGGERAGEVDPRTGQLVDLFPTLLRAAGVDPGRYRHSGVDLLDPDGERRESVFSEYYYPKFTLAQFSPEELEAQRESIAPFLRRLRAVQRYGFRLIWSSDGNHELYDLGNDPGETLDLLDGEARSPIADEFLAMLERELRRYAPGSRVEALRTENDAPTQIPPIDPERLEALEAVGYVR